ncbi:6-carboxytetrahydropterin synthase [Treponema sp. OMZ 840]|uniref:6-pyruvoyl trahydropterin synthase family protein n=1 Tax=Treponema sp. OMZ 840 TaxID=244313 RepID=UPI003D932B20
MYEVCVEADFSAAHFLRSFRGKGGNIHGHNYRVLAYARGEELGDDGMLLDFGVLTAALREVCKVLDCSNLNELKENGVPVFRGNPTAERIARFIFLQLEILLPRSNAAKLYAVDVYETPRTKARYSKGKTGI